MNRNVSQISQQITHMMFRLDCGESYSPDMFPVQGKDSCLLVFAPKTFWLRTNHTSTTQRLQICFFCTDGL